jgi:hypothetical protein
MPEQLQNPFTPVFGKVPPYMAGRASIIDELTNVFEHPNNNPSVVSIFVGARGTGKTALMSLLADRADSMGWVSARVMSAPGMLDEIIQRINRAAGHLIDGTSARRLKSVGIAQLGSIEWETVQTTTSSWRTVMDGILDQLDDAGVGLLVTVDEVDPDLEEMSALVRAFQHFLDEGRNVALVMAGLPYELSSLVSGKTTSFLRRGARFELGPIKDTEIRLALESTVREGGKNISDKALDAAVANIGGFAFMFQLLGYRAWDLAGAKDEITLKDVEEASVLAQSEMESRIYDATYLELTEADRDFLAAMLEDENMTRQQDIQARLGKKSGHVSKYKRRLLAQGIIQERTRGYVEFCLPGFREYFEARMAELPDRG